MQNNYLLPKIDMEWLDLIGSSKFDELMNPIQQYLNQDSNIGIVIYPRAEDVFKAFECTLLSQVKVVILGQDPYHKPNQAHGLSFSVNEGVKIPPSLVNIFKELKEDIGIDIPLNGNLMPWAKQGVLLLNSFLTVKENSPLSHQKIGWQTFTDLIIRELSNNKKNIVFILWGSFAQSKANLINKSNDHLILKSVHPSPLSVFGGFFGSKPFSTTNSFLIENGIHNIDWSL